MNKVRTFLISDSPSCSSIQVAEARRELAFQADFWGYGPLVSLSLERVEEGAQAHVEESDGTPVDVTGRFILHFVGNAA